MKILICGLPKSGTTILTYRIADALGSPETVTVDFEPPGRPEPGARAGRPHVVSKKLVGAHTRAAGDLADCSGFDRRIWISRDPRDFLISQALYRWHRESTEPPSGAELAGFEEMLAVLEAKERSPADVPFVDLAPAHYFETFDSVALLAESILDDRWCLFRYEDMVEGRYDVLENRLGFPVARDAEVDPGFRRVARRKAAGDWRHWFTPTDVEFYRSGGLDRYMGTFAYDRADWRLAEPQRIEARHSSEYVRWLFLGEAAGVERPGARGLIGPWDGTRISGSMR